MKEKNIWVPMNILKFYWIFGTQQVKKDIDQLTKHTIGVHKEQSLYMMQRIRILKV